MQAAKPQPMPTARPSSRTTWLTISIAAVVIVIAMIIAFTLLSPKSGEPGAVGATSPTSTASTPSATPSASPGTPSTPPIDPKFGAPVGQTVPRNKGADFGDKVTAQITSLTEVTATGRLPGEVSGPAVQVDLKITNGTSAAISLDSVTVNVYYGADKTPASPYSQSPNDKFPGTLAAGKSATARFLFNVPKGSLHSVIVTVSRAAGQPIIVFQ